MSNDPNVKETPEVVRPPIVLEGDAGASLAEGDQDLGVGTIAVPTAEQGEELEPMRKPIVIGVEPETGEEDGDRTPKNTNVETIEA